MGVSYELLYRSLISTAKYPCQDCQVVLDAEKKLETKRTASSAAPWTYTGKVKLDSSVCTWVSHCQCVWGVDSMFERLWMVSRCYRERGSGRKRSSAWFK